MIPFTKFENVYFTKDSRGRERFFTQNLTPGLSFFEEDLVRDGGREYRNWEPRRSKLCAGMAKGLSQTGLKRGSTVLYLGASHGYTASFVSDIVGREGVVFCLDFAPRVVRDLVFMCEKKENMAPILGDATDPKSYAYRVLPCDIVFQDVAQKQQAEIFLDNCKHFLKPGGFGILAVKSRSMDITIPPRQLYAKVKEKLEKETTIVDFKVLDPFEKDHCIFVVKKP
ncbi:MAG: fibrillarin-like rRNA/tRNA 2'-O-methyltransferase [Nanoarchaeota archaeon]|nr:fibrillarin-like rRNA/tRNA 2'-O-methyltransferase [Nanoarchaeota archaeon]